MISRGSFPFLKRAMDTSQSLTDDLREVADTHNSAMRTLLEQALKAQAELYKGQLAVVENLIGKLHKASTPPPATHARPAATAPAAASAGTPASTAAAGVSPVHSSRAQAIATATAAATESAALAQQIRPTAELRTAMPSRPTPFPAKDS